MSQEKKPLEGTNTETANDLAKSITKATMPAAVRRYEQKIAHMGKPRLMPTLDEQHEQFFSFGYCSAVYDMMIGEIFVKSKVSGEAMPKPVKTPNIILLGDEM